MDGNLNTVITGVLVLLALASLISTLFWLRLVTVIGAIGAISYYQLFVTPTQWEFVAFGLVFIFVNVYKLWQIRQTGRQLHFSENELALHRQLFAELSAEQFMTLMRIAIWREVNPGDVIVKKDEKVSHLSLMFRGMARVNIGRERYAQIRDGQFIGEMSFVSGNLASGTVTAEEKSIIVEWPQIELRHLLNESSAIGNCIQALFNQDLRRKLGDDQP